MKAMNFFSSDFSGSSFQRAVQVIESCRKKPISGQHFPHPFISPGGNYGEMWWQLDFSLALTGYRWIDHEFCQKGLLNFVSAQKADGRIPLWGNDRLPEYNHERLQREEVSSLPKVFDASSKILRWSTDQEVIETIYRMLCKYLDWWFRARWDERTGLISAVFEETFIPYYGFAGEYAPVDTNVEVAWGCCCTAEIARRLGDFETARKLLGRAADIRHAMNKYLWDDDRHAFFPLLLSEHHHGKVLMASTFDTFTMKIAEGARKHALLKLLTDKNRFGWTKRPLASVDRKDSAYTIINSKHYLGNSCWSGSIWTLINEGVVRGLHDCGEDELASELAGKTLLEFGSGYAEFLNPETGTGNGVEDYAWSAAQCIDMLLSQICGLDYNAQLSTFTISPSIPSSWTGKEFSISDLCLPGGSKLNISFESKEASPFISVLYVDTTGKTRRYADSRRLSFQILK